MGSGVASKRDGRGQCPGQVAPISGAIAGIRRTLRSGTSLTTGDARYSRCSPIRLASTSDTATTRRLHPDPLSEVRLLGARYVGLIVGIVLMAVLGTDRAPAHKSGL